MQGEINMSNYDLEDAIMMLHNIARTIEREWGFNGSLPKDIRACADRLHAMIVAEVPNETL
ncbi:hypothetical protein UFOVP181_139 [uncultured Caudovirales phage]|uniref:Uncharacterized protein n=1 Tax=uncultured Caudovirales phage TaxID=2100421 RepID=A0A6J5KR17_9CAUD|nr:hypothetical protein UFOVP57_23 [uncultured Caudovirales phage]CAB5208742.1 hypothetical protein UFOVP181_139 [uncultured Caudovirales phage]